MSRETNTGHCGVKYHFILVKLPIITHSMHPKTTLTRILWLIKQWTWIIPKDIHYQHQVMICRLIWVLICYNYLQHLHGIQYQQGLLLLRPEIRIWNSNYTTYQTSFLWGVITHPCPNFFRGVMIKDVTTILGQGKKRRFTRIILKATMILNNFRQKTFWWSFSESKDPLTDIN